MIDCAQGLAAAVAVNHAERQTEFARHGHASIQITADLYGHLFKDERECYESLVDADFRPNATSDDAAVA